jgi:NADH-quinone oxidoreductase subunit J
VLFIAQDAEFLAAVQVIVYAGAIVVLFLFVIMLLGVDRTEDLETDALAGQRPAALVAGVVLGGGLVALLVATTVTGQPSVGGVLRRTTPNVNQLGRLLFTDYLFAFEITSVLLVIAVVGAVVLARPRKGVDVDADEPTDDESSDGESRAIDLEESSP